MQILLFIFIAASSAFASKYPPPRDCKALLAEVKSESIDKLVKDERDLAVFLRENGQSSVGTHLNLFLTFHDGTQWVFKDAGEDGWRNFEGEIAAYKLAQEIGNDRVPETRAVSYKGRNGSLQRFLGIPMWVDKDERFELFKERAEEWNEVQIIQYLSGQWDRHAGNIFISQDRHIYAIDNEGSSFHSIWQIGDYPYRRRGKGTDKPYENIEAFPFDKATVVPVEKFEDFYTFLLNYTGPKWAKQTIEKFAEKNLPISYIEWNGFLWIKQVKSSLPVVNPNKLSEERVRRLKALTPKRLSEILPALFGQQHIQEILFRRDLLLQQQAQLVL